MIITPENISSKYTEIHPGCWAGVPNSEYHASNGINSSSIPDMLESPATFELRKKHPKEQTRPMLKGSALHDSILLPEVFDAVYVKGPTQGRRTKAWIAFEKDLPEGKIALTPSEMWDVRSMREAVFKNPTMRTEIEKDRKWREISIWAVDPQTHLVCRIRMDTFVDGWINDIKTTLTPSWRGFKYSIWKYHYFIQSPFYQDVARWAGLEINGFRFWVVGNHPPYSTAIYSLDDPWQEEGRGQYREALMAYYSYIMGDKQWDGLPYGTEPMVLEM